MCVHEQELLEQDKLSAGDRWGRLKDWRLEEIKINEKSIIYNSDNELVDLKRGGPPSQEATLGVGAEGTDGVTPVTRVSPHINYNIQHPPQMWQYP